MARRSSSLLLVSTLLALAASTPSLAQPEAAEAYGSIHPEPPAWLTARIDRTLTEVFAPEWNGPAVEREKVRPFLYETYEHVREVNELVRALGGRPRDLPRATPGSEEALRGIHDFGERISVEKLEAFVASVKAKPLVGFDGKTVPVPEWIAELPREARRRGERTVDIGKLSPYVAAGLARNGNSDRYAIELHRLSGHHMYQIRDGFPRGDLLIETIADKVNAMRQVRVYSPRPLSFEKVREFLTKDLGKSLPPDAKPLIERAIETQARLERSGRVNPYYLVEKGAPYRPADRLARYRRANGTIEWGRMTREGGLRTAGGLAHFTLALFLKEVAIVARTGDRARIEEFFDGLLTTDFYKTYGLFALGAHGGDLAYGRYLARFVKPGFVSGILRTNLVLATGLALPQLIGGTFEGDAFAISLASLGLSTAAVRSGVAGIKWVSSLKRARSAGTLAATSRLARVGGWFYTAAELAVILYLGDAIEERVHAYRDAREARGALADAGERFLSVVDDPDSDAVAIRSAGDDLDAAWTDYRDFLYRPLLQDEAVFARRMEKAARAAKLGADERAALLKHVRGKPTLEARLRREHGSLEAYASKLTARDDAAIADDVAAAVDSYERTRAMHLREVYEANRRGTPLLENARLDSPYAGRSDFAARIAEGRRLRRFRSALRSASGNRLEAYTDEATLLSAAADALRRRDPSLAAPLDALRDRVLAIAEADRRLSTGEGLTTIPAGAASAGATSAGAASALETATGRR